MVWAYSNKDSKLQFKISDKYIIYIPVLIQELLLTQSVGHMVGRTHARTHRLWRKVARSTVVCLLLRWPVNRSILICYPYNVLLKIQEYICKPMYTVSHANQTV